MRGRALAALVRRSVVQMRYPVLGSVALSCLLQLVLVGQAVSIQESQSFASFAKMIPGFIGRGLGSDMLVLASFKGTVMLGYFHPLLIVLMPAVAMYAATEPAHEVESGLVDLVLARSLLVALLYTVLAVSAMAIGTYTGAALFNEAHYPLPGAGLLARLVLHVVAVCCCFTGYALFVAVSVKRWATAFTTAVLTAACAYLVDFLSLGWPVMRWAAYVSPYRYYHALAIASGTVPEGRDYAVLFGGGLLFTIAAFWRFHRRDL